MSPLWPGLVITLACFVMLWLASLLRRDASLVDRWWGFGFLVLGLWYASSRPTPMPLAGWLLLLLVGTWGLRLSLHLTLRNWGQGEDYRYRAMRERHGRRFPFISLGTVFLLQGLLTWVIGMPLYAGLSASPADAGASWLTWAGLVAWLAGFGFEVVGDLQLAAHRADPSRRGTVLRTGVWRYTRHPNYFGDALLWWGHWLVAASVGGAWTAFAPALMTFLLMRVSGVTLLEKKLVESRPGYREYVASTSAFFPRWPRGER
jgi:steroid 5-alpha reductase family enzyme